MALLAALHAVLSIRYQINQIVSGVVINLFALGLTGFLRSEVIVPSGFSKGVATSEIGIPLLSRDPDPRRDDVHRRPAPLRHVRHRVPHVAGDVPHVVGAAGAVVRREPARRRDASASTCIRIRYQAVILGGFIAGLAGAWFSMEAQAGFEDNMTNSAGFIALAALIFGKWTPWGAFGGALLFGFARALGSRLQFLEVEIGDFAHPERVLPGLPFVVTLVVVAGALGRAVAPAAEGQPYTPSK